jgi:iron complex transport system permease protein
MSSVVRNPLATPDVVGVTAGASAAAVGVLLAGWPMPLPLAALGGGLLVAVLVGALSWRDGFTGPRLVLVGIGLGAAASALTSFLLVRAEITEAQRAVVWLTGSLNGRGWEHVRPVGLAVLVLGPLALVLGRSLSGLRLGDDVARGLGVRVTPARVGLVAVAVALAAVATSSAGPIAFVALVAPQIALRLARTPGPPLAASAAAGALLVVAADLVARRGLSVTGLASAELPVGAVTALVGSPVLLWLLRRSTRGRTHDPDPGRRAARSRCCLDPAGRGPARRGPGARVRRPCRRRRRRPRRAVGRGHRRRRRERLRQVDGAARARPAARTEGRQRAARRPGAQPDADPRRRPPARPAPAVTDRPRGRHGRRPGGARPLPAPALVAAVVRRGRTRRPGGDGRHRRHRPADRLVDELSGGQRQRVWLAMALAQETEVLLLDEPTTYLDLAHQVEVLELVAELNALRGRTVVMVLHDLNHAARYATRIVAMKDGRIVAQGTPAQVITEPLVAEVFGLAVVVVPCPVSGRPLVVPRGRTGCPQ